MVRPIDAAKDKVPVIDLADLLCGPGGLQRIGAEWTGRCPLPDHEDKTPSFTANPEKNVWFCHGCLRGGDVVKLAALAWGYSEGEMAMAAAQLLHEFGHEIPERPPAWHRKQSRQEKVRAQIDREKVEHIRLLVFRLVWMPWLEQLPEVVRSEAAERAWQLSRSIALDMRKRGRRA